MGTMVIRNDEHACVEVELQRSLFKLTWKGFVPSPVLRRILIQAHMQVVQHRTQFWLSDSRHLSAMLEKDEKWINKVWVPRIFQTGLVRLAIVRGKNPANLATTNRIVESNRPKTPFAVKLFQVPEQAESWLMQKDPAIA